ncbi:MAG: hypothetical protein KGJ13_00070 [Patescibacteria group bacterium]|nr:hypothetical protein [Patescibacteria group bacterium]
MNIFKSGQAGFWTQARKQSLYMGIFLIVLALFIQINVGHYSSVQSAGAAPAGDLFLDHLPVVNLDFLVVSGGILIWVLFWLLLILYPNHLLFGIKAAALFIIIRAFFTSLTHIGLYPTSLNPGPENPGWSLYHLLTFQGNFFFSGHTSLPFLTALIFWNNKAWRRIFIGLTIFFGAVVLLAHVHYSIDVFAAPFIVYGIWRITQLLFPNDFALSEGKATA